MSEEPEREQTPADPPLPGDLPRCGEVSIGATGVEWICTRPPHADRPLALDSGGLPLPVQEADRHWYVPGGTGCLVDEPRAPPTGCKVISL